MASELQPDEQRYALIIKRDLLRSVKMHALAHDTTAAELIRRYIAEGLERDGASK